jgi:hypothetical protein
VRLKWPLSKLPTAQVLERDLAMIEEIDPPVIITARNDLRQMLDGGTAPGLAGSLRALDASISKASDIQLSNGIGRKIRKVAAKLEQGYPDPLAERLRQAEAELEGRTAR